VAAEEQKPGGADEREHGARAQDEVERVLIRGGGPRRPGQELEHAGRDGNADGALVSPHIPAALRSMPIAIRRSAGKRSASLPEK
jgi:hypothetical protein